MKNKVNRMKERTCARRGFTLIELLTVIAVIAILAALLFPVFNSAVKKTQSSTCMSQMQAIGRAVKLYEMDFGTYPASLFQFAESGGGAALYGGAGQVDNPGSGNNPALYRPLFSSQKYLTDAVTFQCVHNPVQDRTKVTNVVYPTYPGVLLSGPVGFTAPMQYAAGKQNATAGSAVQAAVTAGQRAYYYTFDSYDIGPKIDALGAAVKDASGNSIMELHYSLDWTGGSGNDAHNQLKYPRTASSNNTVITWCSYHSAVANMGVVNVLMLSGNVKTVQASQWASSGPLGYQE